MTQSVQNTIQVTRGNMVESSHLVHISAVNHEGRLVASAGNQQRVTYIRSTAKPLQALAIVESGAYAHYQLTLRELSIICASHNGEPAHVAAVLDLLRKCGLCSASLQCGIQPPLLAEAASKLQAAGLQPDALHNNCSGKHAGMLLLTVYMDNDPKTYREPQHPVQQLMRSNVLQLAQLPIAELVSAIDGCGVPVFGMPLYNLALAYASLGAPEYLSGSQQGACRTIIQAMADEPFYVAGNNRYDTRLIQATGGRIIGKMGAEGVFAMTIPSEQLGLAIKIEDGSERVLYSAATEALYQLDLITADEAAVLADYHKPLLYNWQGEKIGFIAPAFTLLNHMN